MPKFLKIFLVFSLLFIQSSCSWALITGMKNQVAEKINLGKEESNIKGEINKSKDELNADKIETVNKTTTDNSEVGTFKATATTKIENKIDELGTIKAAATANIKTNVSAKTKVKGAVVDNSRENKQSARNIENKEGLFGIDILYLLGGISLLICGIMFVIALIIGKFFMRSPKEKILETKYEEKHLLMSSINQYLFFGTEEEKKTAQNIINDYSNKQLMFGYK